MRFSIHIVVVAAAITVAGLLLPGQSHAQQIVAMGVLTSVDADLQEHFAPGQTYVLTYNWEGPGPAIGTGATGSIYRESGQDFQLRIGTYLVTSNNVGYVLSNQSSADNFYFGAAAYWGSTVPGTPLFGSVNVAGRFPYYAVIELQDSSGQALSDTDPQLPVPDLAAYSSQVFVLRFALETNPGVAFGVKSILGTVDSVSAVPVPAQSALFGIGLLGLICVRKRVASEAVSRDPPAT